VRLFANCFFMNENRRGEIAAILELPLVSLVGIPSATGAGIRRNISNRIREDGALSVLLGKMTLANSKKNGMFWNGDFDG
jgi:hypothetical protein